MQQTGSAERGEQPEAGDGGGRTSGSSTSVTSASRPRNRRASRNAVGVPSTRINTCAAAVVFRLTISASVTTGFPSCATRRAGDTRAKIASTGSARNPRVTNVAAKTIAAASPRRI
jgi:hypothetical protein